ncbi:MAG TPA: hypothetical protein VKY65_18845 [Alphaproteobacteria bacterium]|nr:hypothetical protein [Alphaproteobacteria bacterium]
MTHTHRLLDRRGFLLSTAALGGGFALFGGARRAAAFSIEKIPPQSGLGLAYANRCKSDALHAQILATLDAKLAKETGAKGSFLTLTEICPICGCPITATRYIGG